MYAACGEVTVLRRLDLAPDGSWVRVTIAHTEVVGRGIVVGPSKSRAGVRSRGWATTTCARR